MQLQQAFQEANEEASHLALRTIHTNLRSRVTGSLLPLHNSTNIRFFYFYETHQHCKPQHLHFYDRSAKQSLRGFGLKLSQLKIK